MRTKDDLKTFGTEIASSGDVTLTKHEKRLLTKDGAIRRADKKGKSATFSNLRHSKLWPRDPLVVTSAHAMALFARPFFMKGSR